jgi:hypothetical protein
VKVGDLVKQVFWHRGNAAIGIVVAVGFHHVKILWTDGIQEVDLRSVEVISESR